MVHGHFVASPRSIFLLDGIGAFVSTLLLLIVGYFDEVFGIPINLLYQLLPIAIFCTLFSLTVYFLYPAKWKRFLLSIGIVNILYCCLTFVSIIFYYDSLTILGVAYFSIEIFIILLLSSIELSIAFNKSVR